MSQKLEGPWAQEAGGGVGGGLAAPPVLYSVHLGASSSPKTVQKGRVFIPEVGSGLPPAMDIALEKHTDVLVLFAG